MSRWDRELLIISKLQILILGSNFLMKGCAASEIQYKQALTSKCCEKPTQKDNRRNTRTPTHGGKAVVAHIEIQSQALWIGSGTLGQLF